MNRHTTPVEVSLVERLTQTALSTGRAALAKHGPEAALVAMQPWSTLIERAKRKEVA